MKFKYNSISDAQLLSEAREIKEKMADNTNFTVIKDDYNIFATHYDGFEGTLLPKNIRNPELTEKKNKKREALLKAMRTLGYGVMFVAKEDVEVILSSGFELAGPRRIKGVPDTPVNVEAYITNLPKTIVAKCKKDKNATIYKARVSEDQEDWKWAGENSARSVLVEDLPLGKVLYVQMAQKNNLGQSGWSKITSVRLPAEDEPESRKMNVKRIK